VVEVISNTGSATTEPDSTIACVKLSLWPSLWRCGHNDNDDDDDDDDDGGGGGGGDSVDLFGSWWDGELVGELVGR